MLVLKKAGGVSFGDKLTTDKKGWTQIDLSKNISHRNFNE